MAERPGRGGPRPGFARRDEAPPAPILELNLAILPDEIGVDSLARQIKMSGRAYPLFEIASMILKRSDRHSVAITTKKKSDGTLAQPLFSCALDDSLWLSDSEAIKHATSLSRSNKRAEVQVVAPGKKNRIVYQSAPQGPLGRAAALANH